MTAGVALLDDRAVIEVRGPEAPGFLQRLVTNNVEALQVGEVRYAALLTPQGKIAADFLAFRTEDGFLLDTPTAVAGDLNRRLRQYRLRAKLEVTDSTATLAPVAFEAGADLPADLVRTADPRDPGLWWRTIAPRDRLPVPTAGAAFARDAARIDAGVPEGGLDFAYGDAFPHEANLDHLHGVDFAKGCYVGQEVVSRVHHRGTARKRIVPVAFDGPPPPPGTSLLAGDIEVGVMGSAIAGRGLATVRLDRVGGVATPLAADGRAVYLRLPSWAASPRA